MNLGEIIKNYRRSHSLSMDDFSASSGISKAYIAMLEANENPATKKPIVPSINTIQKAADGMHLSLDRVISMMGNELVSSVDEIDRTEPRRAIAVPLYGPICCGDGGFVDDNIMEYISLPESWLSPSKEYFAQVARGDSMIGDGINVGDILIFEKTSTPKQGKVGCFCIDDNDAMCKKYRVAGDGRIYLMPANPNYDPIPVDPEMEHFRCLGLLAFVISDRRSE
jgi:repressor LexA